MKRKAIAVSIALILASAASGADKREVESEPSKAELSKDDLLLKLCSKYPMFCELIDIEDKPAITPDGNGGGKQPPRRRD